MGSGSEETKKSTSDKDEQSDGVSVLKQLGNVFSVLGGAAAIILIVGYIIVLSFATSAELYGLMEVPLEFYKEAAVTFLSSTVQYYAESGPYLFIPFLILFFAFEQAYFIHHVDKKNYPAIGKVLGWILLAWSAIVLLISLNYVAPDAAEKQVGLSMPGTDWIAIYHYVSLPTLIAVMLYLVFNSSVRRGQERTLKVKYYMTAAIGVSLLVVSLVGYGSTIFNFTVYPVRTLEVDDTMKELKKKVSMEEQLYLFGHTGDRELFFDLSQHPPDIILIDKKQIKSLTVSRAPDDVMRIRAVLNIDEKGIEPGTLLEQDVEVTRLDVEGFMEKKVSDTVKMDDKGLEEFLK